MESFSALLAICAGNSPVMFPLIFAWIKGYANNRETGDLRRHRAHYDVNVMIMGGGGVYGMFQAKCRDNLVYGLIS